MSDPLQVGAYTERSLHADPQILQSYPPFLAPTCIYAPVEEINGQARPCIFTLRPGMVWPEGHKGGPVGEPSAEDLQALAYWRGSIDARLQALEATTVQTRLDVHTLRTETGVLLDKLQTDVQTAGKVTARMIGVGIGAIALLQIVLPFIFKVFEVARGVAK